VKVTNFSRLVGFVATAVIVAFLAARSAEAGFTGTDLFVPGVARIAGVGGSQFYTTLWVTNASSSPANIQMGLLLLGNANPTPVTKSDVIPANATRRYDDIVGSLFGMSSAGGALHVTSDHELLVSCRTYNSPSGVALKDTNGLAFSAVRSDLAIGANQFTQLHGVTTASAESFRYNFGIIEAAGQPVTFKVTVQDQDGQQLSTPQTYSLGRHGVIQINDFGGFSPALSTSNGVVRIDVVDGAGKVIAYASQVAGTGGNPGSNDGTGFEMRFASLPAAAAGVFSINGQSGAVTIQAGAGATVDTSGGTITISGVQGAKGDTGPQGPKGDPGAQGAPGAAGAGGPAARYVLGDAMPVAKNTYVHLNFPTAVYDTDNTITTGPDWQFKAPVKGIYRFSIAVEVETAKSYPETPSIYIGLIYGSQNISLNTNYYTTYVNFSIPVAGSTELLLNAGDTIYFVAYTNYDGNTVTDPTANWVTASFVRAMN
jgi:hypothetical protein